MHVSSTGSRTPTLSPLRSRLDFKFSIGSVIYAKMLDKKDFGPCWFFNILLLDVLLVFINYIKIIK